MTPRRILILAAVLVVYLLLRPSLSAWLGVPLPGLFPEEAVVDDSPPVRTAPAAPSSAPPPPRVTLGDAPLGEVVLDPPPSPATTKSAAPTVDAGPPPASPASTPAPPAQQPSATVSGTAPPARPTPSATTAPQSTTPPAAAPKLGELTDLGGRRYRSTAGLIYVPLRSEHRLEHVLRHAEDDQSKPVHGVFSGDKATILALIDEAYQLAQKGRPPKVTTEEDGERTIYVVDLGRKIGYMGGQSGKRRSFPPCKHLQLVLEGREVITAYPVVPR